LRDQCLQLFVEALAVEDAGERVEKRLAARAIQVGAQLRDLVLAGDDLFLQRLGRALHFGGAGERLVEVRRQSRHVVRLQCRRETAELGTEKAGAVTGLGCRLRDAGQHALQFAADALHRRFVGRHDVFLEQAQGGVIVNARLLRHQRIERRAQPRVHPRRVLIPERERDRVE
jgi:hypothetical protein